MDLTLQRRRQRPARRHAPAPGALVPVAALLGSCALSASLLLVLSDVVSRLG
jgi:hypothetical protein